MMRAVPPRIETLIGLAQRGMTRAAAARHVGISTQRVGQLCSAWPELARAFTVRGWVPVTQAETQAVRRAADAGMTRSEVARACGLPIERVALIVAREGLRLRRDKPGPKGPRPLGPSRPVDPLVALRRAGTPNAISLHVVRLMTPAQAEAYRRLRQSYRATIPEALTAVRRNDLLAIVAPQLERTA